MCRDWTGDHEIRADEEAEYAAAMAEAPPKPEPTDEELNAMWDAYMAERMNFENQEDP